MKPSNVAIKTPKQAVNSKAWRIFINTIWRGKITVLAFAGGMFLFEFITVVTYPSIGGANTVKAVFDTLGPELRRLLKFVPNLQAGFGPANYLAFGYFHPVFLGLGSAFVVSRASDAIAGDIERGTILFLLARPVGRGNLLFGKAAEVAVSLLIVTGGAVFGTGLGLLITAMGAPVAFWPFVAIGLNAYALFLALGGVALLISALQSSAARVAGWATAFALLAFVADFLSVLPVVNLLGWLSPFRFYDPQSQVADGGTIPWLNIVVLLAVALLGYGLAWWFFRRRDIAV